MRENLTTVSCAPRPALAASLIALAGVLASPAALAQAKYDVSMLPPYCKYTQLYREKVPGADQAGIDRWNNILGARNFWHLHHYCFGLEHSNQALYSSRSKQERDSELRESVIEFRYVLERVAPDFALLPEILTRKGENLLRLGNGAEGVVDLNRAIELKPDHWPPYAALSDYYRTLGDLGEARTWAERGLSAAPGTKALQRRLAELDKAKASSPVKSTVQK
jgi:tetratricopeptide (TPR) repeat protein